MANVPNRKDPIEPLQPPNGGNGGPPDNKGVESRLSKLEDKVSAIQIDIGILRGTSATKDDIAQLGTAIAESRASIILWVVTAIFLAQLLPPLIKQLAS